ncbi:MAG: hypothetical protein IJY73_08320, partial [Oscillospiraceae bacterium]|nr:hypothetical protein [Oscillospiraceae bacterium]
MAGIIKGYGYIPVQGDSSYNSNMKTVYGNKPVGASEPAPEEITPEEVLPVVKKPVKPIEIEPEEDDVEYIREEDAKIEREKLLEEYEQLRQKYEKDSEEYILRAKEKAAEVYEKTREIAHRTMDEARAECETLKKEATAEGMKQGYDDGYKKGYDEGYVNALKKCKDTLLELKQLSEEVVAHKSQIYLDYEHALFDAIFDIAQKITLDSLKQKDKAVIMKMLKEAGKRFRGSKNVKITLSGMDISDVSEVDEAILAEVFKGGSNIEFEILQDAPSGTLIIDNGTEITDASVSTQLKMIEQLGKGRYRDKAPTEILKERREKAEKESADEAPAAEEATAEAEVAPEKETDNTAE